MHVWCLNQEILLQGTSHVNTLIRAHTMHHLVVRWLYYIIWCFFHVRWFSRHLNLAPLSIHIKIRLDILFYNCFPLVLHIKEGSLHPLNYGLLANPPSAVLCLLNLLIATTPDWFQHEQMHFICVYVGAQKGESWVAGRMVPLYGGNYISVSHASTHTHSTHTHTAHVLHIVLLWVYFKTRCYS